MPQLFVLSQSTMFFKKRKGEGAFQRCAQSGTATAANVTSGLYIGELA
jgi:hypothetical protein